MGKTQLLLRRSLLRGKLSPVPYQFSLPPSLSLSLESQNEAKSWCSSMVGMVNRTNMYCSISIFCMRFFSDRVFHPFWGLLRNILLNYNLLSPWNELLEISSPPASTFVSVVKSNSFAFTFSKSGLIEEFALQQFFRRFFSSSGQDSEHSGRYPF